MSSLCRPQIGQGYISHLIFQLPFAISFVAQIAALLLFLLQPLQRPPTSAQPYQALLQSVLSPSNRMIPLCRCLLFFRQAF